ncbi:MAG: UbiD family decarboxylase, partial [Phycisphaerales bacterium]
MFESTRAFMRALEAAGELVRVPTRVSPVLEISAIADRESKSRAPHLPSAGAQRTDPRFHDRGGRALLFENVEGSDIPVLINAMGSYRRMEMALGCHDPIPGLPSARVPGGFEGWAGVIGSLAKPQPPSSLRGAIGKLREFAPLLRTPPRSVRAGACQEVVYTGEQADITRLPIIKCWPLDGDLAGVGWPADANKGVPGLDLADDPAWRGRYITLAGIHTIHADDAGNPKPPSRNIGMYRVQALGRRRMAMHWHIHHDGARHWRSWKRKGEPMPVAIVLGGESVLPYAATAPLPPGISEILMAGFLNGRGIPMCPCKTVPLRVPANAEIVIEGYVSHEAGAIDHDPRTGAAPLGPGAVVEGPFGDHTGFYSLPDRYPILEVTAITMRRDAVYPTTIVGHPPQEDYYMGKATERLFLPLLRTIVHDIEDYDLPMFGAFHNCAFVKIRKEYPTQARRVMHSVWGAGQMAWTKHVVVVDDDVDVHDAKAVLRAMGEHCLPWRDIEAANGPLDILDHAAPRLGVGTKLGFDATRRVPGEEFTGPAVSRDQAPPVSREQAEAALSRVRALGGVADAACDEGAGFHWLIVKIEKREPGQGREVLARTFEALRDAGGDSAVPGVPGALGRFVVVVGADADAHNLDDALFHWCANSDPGRDRVLSECGARLGFDATPK